MEIELRVVLLSVGMLILIIVCYDYLRKKPNSEQTLSIRNENHSKLYDSFTMHTKEPAVLNSGFPAIEMLLDPADIKPQAKISNITENIINIYIMPRAKYGFDGTALLTAFTASNLFFGKNNIFNRHANDNEANEILFSVANAIEPGYFYIEILPNEHVQGLALILLPEKTTNRLLAFEQLIRTAKQLAFVLNGELLDHHRQSLTLTTIDTYRKQLQRS